MKRFKINDPGELRMTPAEGNFSVLQESFFFFWQEEILYAGPYKNIS